MQHSIYWIKSITDVTFPSIWSFLSLLFLARLFFVRLVVSSSGFLFVITEEFFFLLSFHICFVEFRFPFCIYMPWPFEQCWGSNDFGLWFSFVVQYFVLRSRTVKKCNILCKRMKWWKIYKGGQNNNNRIRDDWSPKCEDGMVSLIKKKMSTIQKGIIVFYQGNIANKATHTSQCWNKTYWKKSFLHWFIKSISNSKSSTRILSIERVFTFMWKFLHDIKEKRTD